MSEQSNHRGTIPGDDATQRATAIAGCLAELGVQRVIVERRDEHGACAARHTNLPALLLDVLRHEGRVCMRAQSLDAVIELHQDHATWEAGSSEAGEVLRRKFHLH